MFVKKSKCILWILGGALAVVFLIYCSTFFALIGENIVFIERSVTDDEHRRGLSGREELCTYCGMLFVFDTEEERSFWMKDMRFDIDIIWIRDHQIVHIDENASWRGGGNEQYSSQEVIDGVLEVSAGYVEQNSVVVGDYVWYGK